MHDYNQYTRFFMVTKKYVFDPSTYSYTEVKESKTKKIFIQIASFLASGLVFGAITMLIAYNSFESPNEKILKQENGNLQNQYKGLEARLHSIEKVMNILADRDDNIYRVIFEAEPISEEVRQAGLGGAKRYEELEKLDHDQVIKQTTERIDVLSKKLAVQSRSYDEILKFLAKKEIILSHTPAIQPVANKDLKRVASGYGWRTDPIYKTKKFHRGMDFTAPTGTPIYATADGKVVIAQHSHSGYGNQIDIEHGYGYMTRYGHCSKLVVNVGDEIKRGQLIGYVGSTGKSTGPHLHYEVHKDGTDLNPIDFYFSDLTPEEYAKMVEAASAEGQSFD